MLRYFDYFLGDLAYTGIAQRTLAQANYFRDPKRIDAYLKGCHFMPYVNNEKSANATYNKNFAKLEKMAFVKAAGDTMVWPRESEHWGFFADGSTLDEDILPMEQTAWYKQDLFGLKTANEAHKMDFLSTPGDHLQFEKEFLLQMVDTYFKN